MTTDSEAWGRFAKELGARGYMAAGDAALAVAEWLRERQKRGDFGVPAPKSRGFACVCAPDPCACQPAVSGPSRLDAVEALEEKEAPRRRVFCSDTECPACAMSGGQGGHFEKSSSDSMEEENRGLRAALQHCHNLAHVAMTRGGLEEALENIEITTRDALFPHQPWCRGDHSEGACISDPSEVDRGK